MLYFEHIIILLLGLSFGSFANVCINRLPKNDSIMTSSRCQHCGKPIPYYDNIPIFSYLILRGNSRCCKKEISVQYPIIELVIALLSLLIFKHFNFTPDSLLVFIFCFSLVVIFMTDFKEFIIPNAITYPIIILGIVINILNINPFDLNLLDSLIGGIFSAFLFFIISKVFLIVRKKEGLGMGDVKLIAMIGFWIGIQSVLIIIIISSLVGAIFGFIMVGFKKLQIADYLPYGCFISMAAGFVIYLDLWVGLNIFKIMAF